MNKKRYTCPYCFFQFNEFERKPDSNRKKYCPNPEEGSDGHRICNKRLPSDFEDHESKTVAIYGGKFAGKSTFIASLAKLLLEDHDLRNYMKLSASYLEYDEHSKTLLEIYWNAILHEKQFPKTHDKGDLYLKKPIVLSILNVSNHKKTYLTFFDTAGEEFDDIDNIIESHRHIYNADAILFFMDPLQINSMQSLILEDDLDRKKFRFFESEYIPADLKRPDQIVKNLHSAIREASETNLATNEKSYQKARDQIGDKFSEGNDPTRTNFNIYLKRAKELMRFGNQKPTLFTVDVPTAFCISKYDLLEGLGDVYTFENFLSTDEQLFRDRNPIDWVSFFIQEIEATSIQMHDFLNTNEAALFQEISLHFKNYKIMGVAAAKSEDNNLDAVLIKDSKPVTKNLLHPLVWILDELKFFK